jgi:hypothetical protein
MTLPPLPINSSSSPLGELNTRGCSSLQGPWGDATAWTTPHRKGDTSVRADLSPDDPIALRADALCVYWAKLAEADSEVRSFRRKVLEGKAVSANEAGELLSSPATSLISPEAFARNDVPIVGHTAKFIVQKRSNQFERPYTTQGELHIEWSTGYALLLPVYNEGPRPPEPIEVWNGSESIFIAPWSLSVLGQLRKVASKLMDRYS